jgi:hypothetical protein
MNSLVSHVPEGARILNWEYKTPHHGMSPVEAFKMAQQIRFDFIALLKDGFSERGAQKQLLTNQNVLLFSSENGFPALFKMSTSKKTTDEDFEAIYNLVLLRGEVDAGLITEEQGGANALRIAARAKERK